MKRTQIANENLEGVQSGIKKTKTDPPVDILSAFEEIWPESNPFLAPPVLRLLMKKVELPSELKELRNICEIWDQIVVEELKDRALNGLIKPVNLSWGLEIKEDGSKLMSIPEVEAKLFRFLKDTKMNPKLFRGFQINYPQIIKIINQNINHFRLFLSQYSPLFLVIVLDRKKRLAKVLKAFLDRFGIALNLRGLEIMESWNMSNLVKCQTIDIPGQGRFPELQSLILNGKMPAKLFGKIFGDQEFTNLKHFELNADLGDLFGYNFQLQIPSFWTNLTHLDFGKEKPYEVSMLVNSIFLQYLARAGMTLKSFTMHMDFFYDDGGEGVEEQFANLPVDLSQICQNMTEFFESQAKSLQHLSIMIYINTDRNSITEINRNLFKIELPVFPSLRRLEIFNICQFQINGEEINYILSFDSYSHNFPILEDLTILGQWEDIRNWGGRNMTRPLTLKRLKVSDGRNRDSIGRIKTIEDNMAYLLKDVRFVETLEVGLTYGYLGADFFFRDGEGLPWIESLKVLHIYRIKKRLNLGHLKNLKKIVIEQDGFMDLLGEPPISTGTIKDHFNHNYKRYLRRFIHIAKMDLYQITFRGFKMSQEIRAKFVKYFPFRVEFIEKPIPEWNPFSNLI